MPRRPFGTHAYVLSRRGAAKLIRKHTKHKVCSDVLLLHWPLADSGLFVPSCYQHTSNLCTRRGSRVQNVSYGASLFDWVVEAGAVPHQLIDDCEGADPCNPHCDC